MSQLFFNEIEAAKIAQNMERNGLAFFQKAAEKATHPKVKALFEQLADDEVRHIEWLENLEEQLQSQRRGGPGYADDTEIAAYIDRLLQTQVFSDEGAVGRLSDQAGDAGAALAVGMRAERDSILFYQEMLDFVDSKIAKEAFEKILAEERDHLRILGDRSQECSAYAP